MILFKFILEGMIGIPCGVCIVTQVWIRSQCAPKNLIIRSSLGFLSGCCDKTFRHSNGREKGLVLSNVSSSVESTMVRKTWQQAGLAWR